MSKKKYLYAALGLGILTAVALPIFAGAKHHWHHGDRGAHGGYLLSERMIDRFARKLDLDSAQRDALYAAADELRPELREVRRQLRESHAAMIELDPQGADYDARIEELAQRHSEIARDMTRRAAALKTTLSEVLNEAQMERLMKRLSRRHHHS